MGLQQVHAPPLELPWQPQEQGAAVGLVWEVVVLVVPVLVAFMTCPSASGASFGDGFLRFAAAFGTLHPDPAFEQPAGHAVAGRCVDEVSRAVALQSGQQV